eukprot:1141041-Pelagomonas_calceolata.AAC.17
MSAPSTAARRETVSPLLAVLTQLEQAVNPGGRLKHVQWEFKDIVVRAVICETAAPRARTGSRGTLVPLR